MAMTHAGNSHRWWTPDVDGAPRSIFMKFNADARVGKSREW
jgi:hypothetical protein